MLSHQRLYTFSLLEACIADRPFPLPSHRFKVEDSNFRGAFIAWACIRLDRLQPGYRCVDLFKPNRRPCDGQLFIKVEKMVR